MDEMKCPKCGDGCDRESVDVGIGTIHGPWACLSCGWSEDINAWNALDRICDERDGCDLDAATVAHMSILKPQGKE